MRRRLGLELRQLRGDTGKTMEEAAEALGCSVSKISRIETNKVRAMPKDVRDLLEVYGVAGRRRDWLMEAAEAAREKGWWAAYTSIHFAPDVGFEVAASSHRIYQVQVVPGLFQTEEYASAVLRALGPDLPANEIQRRLELRIKRRELLEQADPPALWTILDEAVFRRKVRRRNVMRNQLTALLASADRPNVTLQVLPFDTGEHIGIDGAFTILGFPDQADPGIVYLQHFTRPLVIDDESEVGRYVLAFEHLRATALNRADSIDFLARVAREL